MAKITGGGRIGDVTLNLCALPIIDQPEIKLYVRQPRPDDPRAFPVIDWHDKDHYVVPVENLPRIQGSLVFTNVAALNELSIQEKYELLLRAARLQLQNVKFIHCYYL
ncbi:unnamed protein product [Didymodactylos carnosus]|uniref:Uncharacterized protein n=1 Tax=Didymodactylos carnosus TaxID=1234261 RepID=A0A815CHS7_9BILA|nr:unnamed protein product [Didymodactylos carnosus]CAF1338170.1 unnamed protein product [Didymodactylos carnosus]CAF4082469.1 unnamed protein product [Didymodactylos carnosus]CAF4149465.1 unnamed protein product [Didymodactylos carnosus]